MTDMLLSRRNLVLLAPAAIAACGGSRGPNYYSIVTRPGRSLSRGPKVVMVKDVGLASYLDRREIVRSSEGYKLEIMSNDWWGEPLAGMLSRMLVQDLTQRLPGSSVYGEAGAISLDYNASIGVNIQRLDADRAGNLILIAQVAIEFNRPRRNAARNVTISKPLASPDIPGLVAAISDAVGELADDIAAIVQS